MVIMKRIKIVLCLILISFASNSIFAQLTENRERNPYKSKFVYTDLKHFIKAHNKLTEKSDTITVIQKEYLDKGTPGLKEFIV